MWIDRGDWKLFPNMFVIFVGHPGVGKGRAINPAIKLARRANTVNMMSDKLTIQYILEKLATGFTGIKATTQGVTYGKDASCLISAPEMEVFLTTSEALPSLSELWECKDGPSDYGTRGKGLISIEKPCPTLVGGMTLRQIVDYMSTRVVSGGFTRRVNFVYAANKERSIPRPTQVDFDQVTADLINDLRQISTLQGPIALSEEAWNVYEPYYHACGKVDEFDDEVVAAYATSKWVHVLKLATVLSVAESDNMVISRKHIDEAIPAIERCSADLLRVFRAVGESDMATAADRVLRFIEMKGLTSRQDIMSANWRHMSSQELDIVIQTLESGGLIDHKDQGNKQFFYAIPQNTKQYTKGVTSVQ